VLNNSKVPSAADASASRPSAVASTTAAEVAAAGTTPVGATIAVSATTVAASFSTVPVPNSIAPNSTAINANEQWGLLNTGKNCFNPCEGQGGECPWCGSGICCRKGYRPDIRKGLCLKLQGCEHYHCCTEHVDSALYEPDEPKHLPEPNAHAKVIPAMVIVCIAMALALIVCWRVSSSKQKHLEDRQMLVEAYMDEIERRLQLQSSQAATVPRSSTTVQNSEAATDVHVHQAGAVQIKSHELEGYEVIARQGHTAPFSVEQHKHTLDTRWAFVHK
jgi:hypothetical protein